MGSRLSRRRPVRARCWPRFSRWKPRSPRTLDLDLIAYGRRVIDAPGLTLPHPRAHERRFVMGPLAEIAPGWVHPTLGRTAAELAAEARVGQDAAPVETDGNVGSGAHPPS